MSDDRSPSDEDSLRNDVRALLTEIRNNDFVKKEEFHAVMIEKGTPICAAQHQELVNKERRTLFGVMEKKIKENVDKVLKPEKLAAVVNDALEPDPVFRAARSSTGVKIVLALGAVIFAGLAIFWGHTWNLANKADRDVMKLNIKQDQILNNVKAQRTIIDKNSDDLGDIKRILLRSMRRSRWTTR